VVFCRILRYYDIIITHIAGLHEKYLIYLNELII